MGAAKDRWMAEVEQVGDDYAADKITRDEGIRKLVRLGFDHQEAATMIDEARA